MARQDQFDAADSHRTIVPEHGRNKGKPYRLQSGEKITIDPGAKASHVKGLDELPVFIARGVAEPKISIDKILDAHAREIRDHVGGIGGHPFTLKIVFTRPGKRTSVIKCIGCEISGGLGIDVEDAGITTKLEALCLDIHVDGKSIYARRAD
jgi:hypothetical protein